MKKGIESLLGEDIREWIRQIEKMKKRDHDDCEENRTCEGITVSHTSMIVCEEGVELKVTGNIDKTDKMSKCE